MTRLLATLPLILLAACVQPHPPATPPVDDDLCKAAAMQGLVGQPQSVLATMLLPAGSRVIGPNDAVTMDFRAERLNVEIGADGRIAKVACY
ncbi:I78 family peptidase inhibitor [Paracoccus luteus]|uniref:I78 family peptidase inhibitor n=1 Tax=Paracoccus luteus TaxID=2508543 RepID=UPI00106F12B0|nr:I78 family peptidase inhibitor [Paracoccus luteus]